MQTRKPKPKHQRRLIKIAERVRDSIGVPPGWQPKPIQYTRYSPPDLAYGSVQVISLQGAIAFCTWLDYGKQRGPHDTPMLAASFTAEGDMARELRALGKQRGLKRRSYGSDSKARLRGYDGETFIEVDAHNDVHLVTYRAAGDYKLQPAVDAFVELFRRWYKDVELVTVEPPHIASDIPALEGNERTRMIRHRSRERWKRDQKIDDFKQNHRGRLYCEIPACKFEFSAVYGVEFAHVHHKNPLAKAGPSRTKLSDLAVVCPNCHAMIHHGGEFRSLADIDKMMKAKVARPSTVNLPRTRGKRRIGRHTQLSRSA